MTKVKQVKQGKIVILMTQVLFSVVIFSSGNVWKHIKDMNTHKIIQILWKQIESMKKQCKRKKIPCICSYVAFLILYHFRLIFSCLFVCLSIWFFISYVFLCDMFELTWSEWYCSCDLVWLLWNCGVHMGWVKGESVCPDL